MYSGNRFVFLNDVLFFILIAKHTLIQERQEGDTELYRLREALRDAETRAKAQEEERNQALQKLQASTEV